MSPRLQELTCRAAPDTAIDEPAERCLFGRPRAHIGLHSELTEISKSDGKRSFSLYAVHQTQAARDQSNDGATVFHRQFEWFALIGAPMDVAAIIAAIALAYLLHDRKPTFWLAVAGAICLAAGLAAWFGLVAPANAVLATWKPVRSRPTSTSYERVGKPVTWRLPH